MFRYISNVLGIIIIFIFFGGVLSPLFPPPPLPRIYIEHLLSYPPIYKIFLITKAFIFIPVPITHECLAVEM